MKTLLQINLCVNALSTGIIAEKIGCIAKENGWESYIAYGMETYSSKGRTASNSVSKTIKIGNSFVRLVHRLINRVLIVEGCGSFVSTLFFIFKIRKIKPDVIHLHNIFNGYLNLPLFFYFLRSYNGAIVWTIHDCRAFTGYCTHFVDVNCNNWKGDCRNCAKLSVFKNVPKWNLLMKKRIAENLPNIVFVSISQWMKDCLRESIWKNNNSVVIPNGVDISIFKKREVNRLPFFEDKFVVMGVASVWGRMKGIHDYLDLSKLISDDTLLVLVGCDKIFPTNIHNIIALPKTNTPEELSELYNMADVVTSLSYGETFGMTIIESMSCGTPIICYDNTAQKEKVPIEVGICVETGKVSQVADAINIIKRRGKRFYSDNCVEYVRNNFNYNSVFNDYVSLYNKLTV